jgi:hypothetical protein
MNSSKLVSLNIDPKSCPTRKWCVRSNRAESLYNSVGVTLPFSVVHVGAYGDMSHYHSALDDSTLPARQNVLFADDYHAVRPSVESTMRLERMVLGDWEYYWTIADAASRHSTRIHCEDG